MLGEMEASEKATFYWELMKLLLQVAWADDTVAPEERHTLRALGERLRLDGSQLEIIDSCLEGRRSLPPPNMALLRGHRDDVLKAAEHIAMADKIVTTDEQSIMDGLNSMLSQAPPPLNQDLDRILTPMPPPPAPDFDTE